MKKLTFLTALLFASLSFAQVPNYVSTNGLISWWPFNGNADDESGNGNNGTVNGATLTTDRNGVANKAYSFDGNDFIEKSNWNSILGNNDFTISFWVNPSIYSGWIIAFGNNQDGEGFCCGNWHWNTTEFGAQIWKYNFVSPVQTTINNSIWTNVVIIYHSDTLKTFKNATLVSTQSINYIQTNLNSGVFSIGKQIGFQEFYTGLIDDIGIWNRALTDCEIKNLYNGGVPNSSQTQSALDTYTWPVNNQTYTQSGTYSDTLVNAAGCDSIVTLNLTLSYTGINELSKSTIAISPNPTNGDFTLTGLELFNTISSMTIKDVNGKTIKELDPKAAKFSLGTAKAGVYFLTITAGNKQEVVKIIKE